MTKPFSKLADLGRPTVGGVSAALGARILRVAGMANPAPTQLFELMELARAQGAPKVAAALQARLDEVLSKRARPVGPGSRPAPTAVVGHEAVKAAAEAGELGDSASPVPGVSDEAWERFAGVIAADRALDARDRGGRVGMYATSIRRLADLGVVSNPHKVSLATPDATDVDVATDGPGEGKTGKKLALDANEKLKKMDAWTADWKRVSRDAFLASPRMQHQVLRKSMGDYAQKVQETMAPAIGKPFTKDGDKKVTLSGLLAVAHVAGLKGLESWLRNPEERKRFPHTTRLFTQANGIF